MESMAYNTDCVEYRLGFDFVGCELDREYYEKQEERFRRECLGETVAPDGKIYKQLEIF